MWWRSIVVVFVGLLLLAIADWQSTFDRPCTVPIEQSGEAQQQSQGAEKSCPVPKVVVITRALGTGTKALGTTLHQLHDDVTAAATFVIAIFTVVLVLVTNRQVKLTKASVLISQRALTELEAPFVSVKIIRPGIEWNQVARTFSTSQLEFTYVNYGRTPATIFEAFQEVRFMQAREGVPPPINARNDRGVPLPYGIIAPPNGEAEPSFTFNIFAGASREAERDPSPLRQRVPFFMGFVMFGDIFNSVYTLGFCFVFDHVSNSFMPIGGEEHNYCRKEPGPYRPPGFDRPAPTPPPSPPTPTEPEAGDLVVPK